VCFDFLTISYEIFLVLRRIKRGIVNVRRSLCDILFILVGDFDEK